MQNQAQCIFAAQQIPLLRSRASNRLILRYILILYVYRNQIIHLSYFFHNLSLILKKKSIPRPVVHVYRYTYKF